MQKEIHWNFIHHKDLILKALLHGKILIDVKNYWKRNDGEKNLHVAWRQHKITITMITTMIHNT